MKKPKPKTVSKPWGKFIEYATNKKVTVKIIHVKKGGKLSLQSHRHRAEFWIALDEGLTVLVNGRKKRLKKGETAFVPRKAKHRVIASKNARFLEIAYGKFDEKDIKRFEDVYGRA